MAHFYGTLVGSRGEASRLGTKNSGLRVTAASWDGAICTVLYRDHHGRDCAHVEMIPWHGRGSSRVLYDGPVSGEDKPESDA